MTRRAGLAAWCLPLIRKRFRGAETPYAGNVIQVGQGWDDPKYVVIAAWQQTHVQPCFGGKCSVVDIGGGDQCGQKTDLKILFESLIRNMVLANGLFELFDDGEGGYAVCDLYLSIDSQGMDAL